LKRHWVNSAILVAVLIWAPLALAQTSGVQVGDTTLYPSVGISFGYDDNVALSNTDQISSYFYLISPALRWQAGSGRSQLTISYQIDHAEYRDSQFDDYTDHSLDAGWQYDPTGRSILNLSANYQRGHDRRGEGIREFLPATIPLEVDKYEQLGIDALYRYGADGARGRFEISGGFSDKDYRNNRELTPIGDYDERHLGAALHWRVAPKTRVIGELGYSEFDYDLADRDGDETFYGLGVAWDATAKTEGRASFRYLEKQFDNGDPGYSGEAWEVAVRWAPKEYSVVELSTSRLTDVALGASNVVVRDTMDISWRHEWRQRFATFLDAGLGDEEFIPGGRDDDVLYYGAGFSYQARHWLHIGLSYRHQDRDSSLPVFDYDRNEFLLSFEIAP
jgi:hypothetical protein